MVRLWNGDMDSYLQHCTSENARVAHDESRTAIIATPVTLNGKRACISGARNDFATVTQLDSGLSAEWSWAAVSRVVTNDGDFRS